MPISNTTGSDFESMFESTAAEIEADPTSAVTRVGMGNAIQGDVDDKVVEDELGEDETFDDVSGDSEDETDDSPGGNTDSGFDWNDHKDELVNVKVSGTEIQVPLSEALNGYMRQEDYTRKTQAVAQDKQFVDWAKTLRSALDENPRDVITALADAYKVSFNANVDADDPYTSDDPEIHKLLQRDKAREQQLADMRTQLDQVNQERVLNQVKAEVAEVQNRYPDFQAQVVLPVAMERGLTIEDAYLYVKGRDATLAGRNQIEAERKAAEKAQIESDKRKAAKKISRPNGVGGRGTTAADKSFDSFGDMFADALSERR